MDDRHLSVDLLRAIHLGEREPGDLTIVAVTHLFDRCPQCRKAFESWRRELGEGVADPMAAGYDDAFERARQRLGRPSRLRDAKNPAVSLDSSIEQEREGAAQIAEELLALPRRRRIERVRSERATFNGPLLADALLERGRGFLPGRPDETYEAAGLARLVLQHDRPNALASELYARALAHQANARRVQGELRSAGEIFEIARYLLKAHGGGDRSTRAELDSLEGSLRGAQRRFAEAESLFSRAIMSYAMEGEELDVARTLLSLGVVYREVDDLERAIEVTNQATEMLEEDEHPQIWLMARHNLVSYLIEAGRIDEARRLFEQSQGLYEAYSDPPTLLRRLWVEANLARFDGQLQIAEEGYRTVYQGFLRQGICFDAALAALDLAVVYAEQGRTAELEEIAEEIVPIFEAQDVHREAMAALMLFRDAVRSEQVTLGYLVELSRYLERARLDPSLQFQVPT